MKKGESFGHSIDMKKIYTAHSKRNYYAKHLVSAYVLKKGALPLNPFMNWGYFLDDLVERESIRNANNELVELSDEMWQFGEISNGCYHELVLAMKRKIPIKFFTVGGLMTDINPISIDELVFEEEVAKEVDIQEFIEKLRKY